MRPEPGAGGLGPAAGRRQREGRGSPLWLPRAAERRPWGPRGGGEAGEALACRPQALTQGAEHVQELREPPGGPRELAACPRASRHRGRRAGPGPLGTGGLAWRRALAPLLRRAGPVGGLGAPLGAAVSAQESVLPRSGRPGPRHTPWGRPERATRPGPRGGQGDPGCFGSGAVAGRAGWLAGFHVKSPPRGSGGGVPATERSPQQGPPPQGSRGG